jgi:hypothetical protein
MSLIFVVILIFIFIGFYFYNHHKKSKILPEQIIEVKKLIDLLNRSKIEISFCIYDEDVGITIIEKPVSVNFFGISIFSSEPLYLDFEDDLVLFEAKSEQLFELKKSINEKLLPKIVLDELSDFFNNKLSVMEFDDNDDRPKRFVSLKSHVRKKNDDLILPLSDILLKGDAVAFESWINLKDHVEELEFVILQWLKDTGEDGNEIIKKFETCEERNV